LKPPVLPDVELDEDDEDEPPPPAPPAEDDENVPDEDFEAEQPTSATATKKK
jgi:hypothetical protein